jgi:hypothetical protein
MEKINFKKAKYDTDLILDTFNLDRSTQNCKILQHFLDATGNLTAQEIEYIEPYRALLANEGDFWNKEELKMHFLAHIFAMTHLTEPKKIKLFYERTLKDEVDGNDIFVICDCMVASPLGVNKPRYPYFFLQEFKKAKKPDDPEGQMLLAMIVAQHKNNNGKPIYGCWLQGKSWNFTTLHDKNYCVSKTYDATDSIDLYQIIYILRHLKFIILSELI